MVVGGVGRSATIIRSTELFLPSNNRWIMAQHLPRYTSHLWQMFSFAFPTVVAKGTFLQKIITFVNQNCPSP